MLRGPRKRLDAAAAPVWCRGRARRRATRVSAVTRARRCRPSRRCRRGLGERQRQRRGGCGGEELSSVHEPDTSRPATRSRDLAGRAHRIPAWTSCRSRGRMVLRWHAPGGTSVPGCAAPRRGSASDLEALFRAHWPRAHRAAYLVVHDAAAAEDIAQEAFLAAVRNLDRFDRRRPFGPWLHRIVVNRAIDAARARALRARDASSRSAGRSPRAAAPPIAASSRRSPRCRPSSARWSSFATCSTTRPARSRELLELPRGTVNSRLRRGLDAMRELL